MENEFGDEKNGNNKKMERVCEICEKVFRSGKALGGHMRSHLLITTSFNKQSRRQENATAAAGDCGGGGCGKCRCVICGKNFPSMKSLFGHMRCHPDRDWRGINPPPPPPPPFSTADNLTSSSSSASSSLSDVNNPSIIGFEERMDCGKRERAVDLTESLRGWAVTAKRGRKAEAAAEEDDRLRDAVNFLMMLAEGKHMHSLSEGEEVVDIHEERERGVIVGGESHHEIKLLLKKKKRKKVKQLCDLKSMENDNYNILDHNTTFPTSKGVMLDFDLNEEPPLELSS